MNVFFDASLMESISHPSLKKMAAFQLVMMRKWLPINGQPCELHSSWVCLSLSILAYLR